MRLELYDNSGFERGASRFKEMLWLLCGGVLFTSWLPGSSWRTGLLQLFGAQIGKGVVIKPKVRVTLPWRLKIGDYSWIGEGVWIDNLANVKISDNVVLSQGAYLLTGSHDYKKESFDLIISPIVLEDGVWIAAKSVVCPGVICKSHSVLSVGSVATSNLDPYTIYQGVPAVEKRARIIG